MLPEKDMAAGALTQFWFASIAWLIILSSLLMHSSFFILGLPNWLGYS